MHAPLSLAFRAEWRALDALDPIVDEWRALAGRALEPNVFYEPAFMLAAAPVFGANAGVTLVWSAAGRLMGLFPARIERGKGGPLGALVGWTHPYAPLGTPLVDRHEAEGVIAAWLDHLAVASPSARLLLPFITEDGPFAATLDRVLASGSRRTAVFGRHQRALLSPGADRTGYLERTVPARKRKELRRQRRRLDDVAPLTFATAAANVEAALQDFLVLEASGWKGVAGTAAVLDPAIRRFIETAIPALAAHGQARIDRLLLKDRTVATTITLVSGDTAWCWKIAYSEGVAKSSPGVQLVLDLTESLLADPAVARVDSCATADHPMIDHIWRERLLLCDRLIELRPAALPFAFACGWEALRRSAIAAAKAARDRLRG